MGDAKMLDGIEVKGSVYSTDIEDAKKKKKTTDPLDEYPLLPRQLHSLISSDLFSDVVFEIEGKRVTKSISKLNFFWIDKGFFYRF